MLRVSSVAISLLAISSAASSAGADGGVVAVAWGTNGFVHPREGFRNAVSVSAGGNHTAIVRAD